MHCILLSSIILAAAYYLYDRFEIRSNLIFNQSINQDLFWAARPIKTYTTHNDNKNDTHQIQTINY